MRTLPILLVLAACGPKVGVQQLRRTVWQEICPGSNPEISSLRFRDDGGFDFSYPEPDDWQVGDDETWAIEGRTLVVSWNGGYATTRYDLSRATSDVIPGASSKGCGNRITLVRVR